MHLADEALIVIKPEVSNEYDVDNNLGLPTGKTKHALTDAIEPNKSCELNNAVLRLQFF